VFPPGSIPWLLGYEMRLAWRGLLGRRGGGMRGMIITLVALTAVAALAGVPLGLAMRRWEMPITRLSIIVCDLGLAVTGSLMLSQTLASATEALYQRGDLDLLFSSPLDPRRTLTVRFLAVALNAFLAFSALFSTLLLPVALISHPAWLAAYLVVGSMALAATGLGLILGVALFKLIGPKRTRAAAQILAAIIGAIFFLSSQLGNMLGGRRAGSVWSEALKLANNADFHLPPLADWPLRAMLGQPAPLAALTLGSAALFIGATQILGGRFARLAAAASGADTSVAREETGPRRFAADAFSATLRKELRLLWRDAALISQVLLRLLYLAPLAILMIRWAGRADILALPGGAAALAFMSGQVAGSLAWITISAEDAPDLLACAPSPPATFRQAKLAAAFLPLAVLLAPFLVTLTVLTPLVGLAAVAGSVASAIGCGMINIWYQRPAKRSEFRRRRGSSWFSTLAEILVGGLIAAATGAAAAHSAWAVAPAAGAALLLLALRRSDAQIAKAIADEA